MLKMSEGELRSKMKDLAGEINYLQTKYNHFKLTGEGEYVPWGKIIGKKREFARLQRQHFKIYVLKGGEK